MQTVDRRGVHIEQCQGCRGIFLDRGELEQIASAEQTFYASGPPPYQSPSGDPHRAAAHRDSPYAHRDSPPPYGGHRDSPPPYGKRRGNRRRGFLEELFD
jgi:Zn-finger nucleic acid-binding protein